jgi:hypothetical protein
MWVGLGMMMLMIMGFDIYLLDSCLCLLLDCSDSR